MLNYLAPDVSVTGACPSSATIVGWIELSSQGIMTSISVSKAAQFSLRLGCTRSYLFPSTGYPHLTKLLKDTESVRIHCKNSVNYVLNNSEIMLQPWLLSNIVDTITSKVPEGLYEYVVLERAGLRIGFIGLIEE